MSQSHAIPELDAFVHEPARLRVLALLCLVDQADFMYLTRQTGMSRGNLSVQMTKLESAGFVALERQLENNRARTCYRLTPSGHQALVAYKASLRPLFDALPDRA